MEKIIRIDGKDIKFKSTAAYLFKYKAQFGRDAIQDMLEVSEAVDSKTMEVKEGKTLSLLVLYDMVWTLAKAADPTIPPPEEWLDGFEEFPLVDHMGDWMEMIRSTFKGTVQSKKKT